MTASTSPQTAFLVNSMPPTAAAISRPVLSLFPGIDLLGRAFAETGFCVVRGPDILWGDTVYGFHPTPGAFEGLIGGSPCQDFSRARRDPPTGEGRRLVAEFVRCVEEARPDWCLLENVPGVPDIAPAGYVVQRFNLAAAECGCRQRRLRRFQFGSLDGVALVPARRSFDPASVTPCAMATEGTRKGRRGWADFCEAQGLPRDFKLPGWPTKFAYRAVGNGVPLQMGRVVAAAIRDRSVTPGRRLCVCECGRLVKGNGLHATASCRKRMERARRRVTAEPCRIEACQPPDRHAT